jgi:hypothetical protein
VNKQPLRGVDQMSRYSLTLLGLVLMTGFGIFFGIEIATRGMERIQGPIPAADYLQAAADSGNGARGSNSAAGSGRNMNPASPTRQPAPTTAPQTQTGASSAAGTKGTTGNSSTQANAGRTPLPPIGAGVPAAPIDSNVNRLGNGIGKLLQGMAHQTIRVVVGLFDRLVN